MSRAKRMTRYELHTPPSYIVSRRSQFVEGLHVEPGAFIAVIVQRNTHRVLFQESWQTLVHGQELVAFDV